MEGLIFGILQYFKSILNIYEYKSERKIFFLQKYHFPFIQYLEYTLMFQC